MLRILFKAIIVGVVCSTLCRAAGNSFWEAVLNQATELSKPERLEHFLAQGSSAGSSSTHLPSLAPSATHTEGLHWDGSAFVSAPEPHAHIPSNRPLNFVDSVPLPETLHYNPYQHVQGGTGYHGGEMPRAFTHQGVAQPHFNPFPDTMHNRPWKGPVQSSSSIGNWPSSSQSQSSFHGQAHAHPTWYEGTWQPSPVWGPHGTSRLPPGGSSQTAPFQQPQQFRSEPVVMSHQLDPSWAYKSTEATTSGVDGQMGRRPSRAPSTFNPAPLQIPEGDNFEAYIPPAGGINEPVVSSSFRQRLSSVRPSYLDSQHMVTPELQSHGPSRASTRQISGTAAREDLPTAGEEHADPGPSDVKDLPPATGLPDKFEAWTVEQRMVLLNRLGRKFLGFREEKPTVYPYEGKKITVGLLEESFGRGATFFRQAEKDIFLVKGVVNKKKTLPVHTRQDGKMPASEQKDKHLYIWERSRSQQGFCIFRLVGMIETNYAHRTNSAFGSMAFLKPFRQKIRRLGTDAIITEEQYAPLPM